MSGKLKIYACSGIGSTKSGAYDYWTDNTATISNTQAVNTMLALINRNRIEVLRLQGLTDADKCELLNDIDLYVLCMAAARNYADDNKKLLYAGVVIGNMVDERKFSSFESLDNDERDAHLDALLETMYQRVSDEQETSKSKGFIDWYERMIIRRNKVGLTTEQQQKARKSLKLKKGIKGIGAGDWTENSDLAEYLTKGSEYFLYLYFTDEQLAKLPAVFKIKAKLQKQTYDYCKQLFVDVYGSEDAMQEIIYAGIVDYNGHTPEEVCEKIAKDGKPIGSLVWTVADIIAVISACLTFLLGVITAICTSVAQTNVAKYGALDKQALDKSTPNTSDFDGIGTPNSSDWTKYLPILAIAAGIYVILKN